MSNSQPLLVEENPGGFTTHWYCEVPPKGAKFRVHRDHWSGTNEKPVREIYEVEITDPGQSSDE